MAGDVNSNIFINVDTSSAMAQLRALEKELTALNRALVTGTKTAAQAQAKYAQGLLHNVNATGQWTASMTRMKTATEQFATALDRSKLSLKDYFRYGVASTKTFGRVFGNEFDTVSKLVEKRVKVLQQQYVQLGRDAQGAMNALKFTPKALNYRDVTTQLMLATQRQQIFNKLLDDGSTKLLNFGKNTQWAGRQLMVGFTVPLMLFGTQAIRTFKEIETQIIRFKKVYGDIYTDPGQTEQALKNIRALADEYTKYGVKVADTIKMAADAAAAGNSGKDLEQIVEQTNRLAVLGGVTQEKALETTIALKNAFEVGANDLDKTINFLNAVENQTVVALDDLTEAIPRVAPVVKQLGGDVKDLAFFMAAMQEGGISAAQGANALKSGLGSLINPSKKAAQAAADVGVNIKGIVEANQGNLRNIVVGFAQALEPLTDLQRTRVIEDVFGKYQFARISALLNNVTKEGTQASRVLQLANASVEELAILSERELGVQADSAMNKFAGSIERMKAAIAPIGEIFAKTLTPAIEFVTRIFEKFNKLPDGIKKGIAVITAVVGGLGPIFLMTFGLLANALANTMKGFNLLRKGYQSLAYGSTDAALKTQYLTNEELENISITNALYTSHDRLSAAYKIESTSLGALIAQYNSGTAAMRAFSASNPGLFVPGKVVPPIRRAGGGAISGPGTSTSDSIPAYVSDGEYVVNAKAVDKYGVETFDALNARKYSTGGPVIGKDGVPRLFGGAWMNAVRSMMPKTRLGIVQDGFALSGFGGAARTTTNALYYPNSPKLKNWRSIPWEDDKDGLLIRDPGTGETYKIAKSKKKEFDDAFAELVSAGGVQKFKDRPSMTAGEYLIHRLHKYQKVKKKPLRPSSIFGQVGSAGKKKNKNAPSEVKGALTKAAMADPNSNAAKVLRSLKSDIDFLEDTPRLTAEEKNTIKKYLTVDVAHIDPKDRFLWSTRTGSRDVGVINRTLAYERKGYPLKGSHIFTNQEAVDFLNYLKVKEMVASNMGTQLPATHKAAMLLLERRIANGFYDKVKIKDTDIGLQYRSYRTDPETRKSSVVDEFATGGMVRPKKYNNGVFSVPGPKGAGDVVPAMLSPGEAVIPTEESQKYRPLIKSIIADSVPGYATSNIDDPWDTPSNVPKSRSDILGDRLANKIADATTRSGVVGGIARRIASSVDKAVNSGPTPMTSMERSAAARAVPPSLAQPFMALNSTIAANTEAVDDDTDATKNNARTAKQIADEDKKLRRTQGLSGLIRGYGKIPDFDEDGNKLTYQQKRNARQAQRMQTSQRAMGVGMAAGAIGSVGMMYGMAKPDSWFGQNMNLMMGLTALAGILPLINSPLRLLAATVLGLTALFKMQSAQIKQSIIDGQNQGRSMLMTTNQLEELGKITNRVSLTQTAEAKRRARTTEIVPVSMDFGQNLITNSDYGKQLKAAFDNTMATLGSSAAAESLANQLSTAVTQGVLTATQAESIAVALTRNLKNAKLEMDVRGRLIQLIGPNGDNILENPVQVQMNLIASNKQIQQAAFSNLQSVINKERSGFLGVSGKEGLQLGGGAVVGAGAGLYAASKAKAAMDTAKTGSKVGTALKATRVLRLGSMAATGSIAGAIPGLIGTTIFGGIEIALRQWQKGNEKKAIAKAAGLFSGVASENLRASQQSIDAINFELDNAIANLEVKKKLAKTSAEKAAIDKRIADLELQRESGLSKVRAAQGDILKSVTTQYSQVSKGAFTEILPGGSGRGQVRDKFMEAFSTGLKEKFKGNAGQLADLSALQSTLDKLENDEITLQISTLIDSDVLTPQEAGLVVANLSKDKKLAQKELEAIVNVQGTEGLQRLGTIMTFIPKAKNRKDLQVLIKNVNKTDADEVMSAIEELIKLPSYLGFNINIETQKQDQARLQKVGEEIADLKKMIPDGQLSIKLLQDLQQKAGGPGKNLTLDAAIAQWETLSKLPKELQFSAMITIGSISQSDSFDKILDRELEAAFKKANPTFAMPTNQMPSTLSAQYAAEFDKFKADQKNIDAATKAYFAKTLPEVYGTKTPSTVKTPTGGTTGEKGKGPDTSWLSDLLQRLKLLKEGSIDATGSFKELLGQVTKFFGPGLMSSVNPSLDKTRGALLQIEEAAKAAGITLSTEFMDFIEGLDAEQFEEFRNQFLSISKGKIVGFKGTNTQFFGSDAAYERRQKAIKDGTFDGSQQSLFGQVNEAFRTRTIAEFIKKQQDSIKDTNLQVEAFRKLTDATGEFKFDAMAAMEVLKDPNLAKEIALGKKIFSPEEREAILTSINQTYAAASKLSKVKMIQDTQSLQNQVKAFEKLTAEGYDYTTILKVIENEAYAYEIANDQVDGLSEATKALVKDTENYINALNNLESTKFFEERNNALQLKKDFAAIAPLLAQSGASLSDINEILSNPTLAKAFIQELKDGSLDAGRIKEYLDQIPEFKQVDIELKISTREGQEEEFDKLFSKAMEYYDLLEAKVEDDFEPLLKNAQDAIDKAQEKVEGINKEIQDYQDNIDAKQRKIELEITRPIDILQKESSGLSNDLELMNRDAEAITKKYDEQAAALTKVFEINSRIANQQKQQLTLADALSQGDISAAAVAAQEMRASEIEAMKEDQLGVLGAAKDQQIANLRSKGGLTRLQIENRQFAISQEIYELEKKRDAQLLEIRKIEDTIYDIKVGRLKLAQDELDLANKTLKDYQKQRDAAIEAIDRQREVWRDAQLAIGFARIDAGYYNDVIEFSNTLVNLMKDGWLGVGDAILAAVSALALYNAGLTKKPLTFEQAQAQAQNTLTGYLDVFGSKLGSADQQIIDLETKIAEAMERGEDTSALEAQLAALRASTEILADNMYDVAGALDKVDNATTIPGINAAVSQGTSVIKNPYGDIDIEWEPIWVPGDGEGGAGGDFVQVASKGGIIKPRYLRKGGLTGSLYRSMGGTIPRFLNGGFAKGTDTVPAMLTPGEFVMSRYAVNSHGIDKMRAINSGDSIGDSVYNYSINVNVKSDANPDEIARAVMTHIKQVDSKRLRGANL
jgi:TP901 family phage tail tape measure protein